MSDPGSSAEQEFRRLYAESFDAILGFALRRTSTVDDAADVTAETFLVAWRRIHEVPSGPRARLWLYGVARRTLANHRRGEGRRQSLGARLREELTAVVPDPTPALLEQQALRAALGRLATRDREVLELTAWEGLEPREVADVLGISPAAARTRLSRSRGRLRALLSEDRPGDVPTGRVSSVASTHLPKESPGA